MRAVAKATLAATTCGALVASALIAPAAAAPTPATPTLSWRACTDQSQRGFQCATAQVPLDYRNPRGKTIGIALIRLPAADPSKRIGSLFLNFGGPGSAATRSLPDRAKTVFTDEQRARFDLVGFDPRGIAKSSPAIRCFATEAEKTRFFDAVPDFPAPNRKAEDTYYRQYRDLDKRCAAKAGEIASHMSTANVARDLDQLRKAVGDRKLNFYGFSYGTVLGATYANLFPNNVRSIVLDGALDFVGNATGHGDDAKTQPVDVRQDVAAGAQETFTEFLRLCAKAGQKCSFSAGGDLAGKWTALLEYTKKQPIVIPGEDGKDVSYTYSDLVGTVYYALFKPMTAYESTGTLLQKLYDATKKPAARKNSAAPPARADEEYLTNSSEAFQGVQCADSDEPADLERYRKLGASEDKRIPGFGRLATYTMTGCAKWPFQDSARYMGPWDKSATPILVVNSTHDPATLLAGAKAGTQQLKNARLLTLKGAGHTGLYTPPSNCLDAAETRYLVSGQLPTNGATCEVDKLPWGLTP